MGTETHVHGFYCNQVKVGVVELGWEDAVLVLIYCFSPFSDA